MRFIKVSGTAPLEAALGNALHHALSKKVLWLVPGGSNAAVAVRVMRDLPDAVLPNLTIALTDERFGQPGHNDSNFYQLLQQGFDARGASFTDLLKGKELVDTVKEAETTYQQLFMENQVIVGFMGIGSDGHIAGLLPHSPASEPTDKLVTGYETSPFTRITLTKPALLKVTHAIVGAFGTEKHAALEKLRDQTLSFQEQPAQILKSIQVTDIFNDQIGEKI